MMMHSSSSAAAAGFNESGGGSGGAAVDSSANSTSFRDDSFSSSPYLMPWPQRTSWIVVFAILVIVAAVGNSLVAWIVFGQLNALHHILLLYIYYDGRQGHHHHFPYLPAHAINKPDGSSPSLYKIRYCVIWLFSNFRSISLPVDSNLWTLIKKKGAAAHLFLNSYGVRLFTCNPAESAWNDALSPPAAETLIKLNIR